MAKHNFNIAARIQSNRHDVYARFAAARSRVNENTKLMEEAPMELAAMMQMTGDLTGD